MPTEISRDEVQKLVAGGAQLVDVRGDVEYGEEHIAGAISAPLDTLNAGGHALDAGQPLIVY